MDNKIELKKGERIDDLQINGLKIIQSSERYCFCSDAVELANFVDGNSRDKAVDLGSGGGIISILLAGKKGIKTTGVEIQKDLADMSRRSVKLCGLENMVDIINAPMQEIGEYIERGSRGIVVCNPPYRPAGSGEQSLRTEIAACRHEINVTLKEIVDTAAYLLSTGGRFYIVHQTQRMAEVISACAVSGLEPKDLQILTPDEVKKPHIFMLKCVKDGRPGLDVRKMRAVYSFDTNG